MKRNPQVSAPQVSADAIVIDREDLKYLRHRLEEQRSVHEMVLAVARLCESSTETDSAYLASAMWPGIAIVMDHMSATGDDLIGKVEYWNKKATAASTGGAK